MSVSEGYGNSIELVRTCTYVFLVRTCTYVFLRVIELVRVFLRAMVTP